MRGNVSRIPLFLSKNEVDLFLKSIRRDRIRLGFLLMSHAGLRVSEVCALKVSDINLPRRYIRVRGKGDKERIVPLNQNLLASMEKYLHAHADKLMNESCLLGGARSSWHCACKRYASLSLSRSDIHCHTLRHSFATNLYEEGVQIEKIGELLGHAKLDTTMIYAHISIEKKRSAVMVLDDPRFRLVRKITTFTRTVTELTVKPWHERAERTSLVGRSAEEREIAGFIEKGISLVLIGEKGCGKSALLHAIHATRKMIYIEEYKKKQSLVKIILDAQNIEDPETRKGIEKELKKHSVEELVSEIAAQKCGVIIDDISELPRADKKVISKLSSTTLVCASSRKQADKKLFPTYIEIKPLKRHYTRIVLSDMIQMTDPEKKEHVVDDILHTAGDNLKEAEYIARQIQLGKDTQEITTDERASNQVSIAPVLTIMILFFVAWVLKSYAAGMVAFSYAVLVVFRMVFYRYIFTPAISKARKQ
ncbi:MAG TPA: tyrosine-type recombinase/integrase [Spirochaetota bacterium]|nr:tyrosine-type recombinase/integrase [Spirochaetota bacterium]